MGCCTMMLLPVYSRWSRMHFGATGAAPADHLGCLCVRHRLRTRHAPKATAVRQTSSRVCLAMIPQDV
jgi:hypothetical protein